MFEIANVNCKYGGLIREKEIHTMCAIWGEENEGLLLAEKKVNAYGMSQIFEIVAKVRWLPHN
jgi:hypothetical protein